MKKILFNFKLFILSSLKQLLSYWRKPLNKTDTIELLNKNIVYEYHHNYLDVKSYSSLIGDKSNLKLKGLSHNPNLDSNTIDFEPDYIWQISRQEDFSELQICASGHPLIDRKLILNLDFGAIGAFKELPVKFKQYNYELVITPWSHNFGGYYAFLLLIMTKLCRIETFFGRNIWNRAKVCYPLLHTSFEQQYLKIMGITEDNIVDTRQRGIKIKPKTLILANSQSEINRISPVDIQLLRKRFLGYQANSKALKNRRIFLSRRNRRILINEVEIRNILTEYNFEIIEDVNHTVDEQISLFSSASIIMAVHGAGLSNLVWCAPKTKVIELFYSGYNIPCFYYLSTILNLEYACLFDKADESEDSFANQYCNLEIDPDLLRSLLEKVLT